MLFKPSSTLSGRLTTQRRPKPTTTRLIPIAASGPAPQSFKPVSKSQYLSLAAEARALISFQPSIFPILYFVAHYIIVLLFCIFPPIPFIPFSLPKLWIIRILILLLLLLLLATGENPANWGYGLSFGALSTVSIRMQLCAIWFKFQFKSFFKRNSSKSDCIGNLTIIPIKVNNKII